MNYNKSVTNYYYYYYYYYGVTLQNFSIDCRLSISISLMLYIKFGWPTFHHHHHPPVLLIIPKIKLIMDQVR